MGKMGELSNSLVSKPWEYPEVVTNRPLIALEIKFTSAGQIVNDMGGMDQALVKANLAKTIPVTHLEMGVSRVVSAGNQSSSGSALFKSLRFASSNDSYTALLVNACLTGDQFKTAKFSYVAHSGKDTSVIMSISLEDGYLTDVEVVDGLVYCELTTRTLAIDNTAKKVMSYTFFDK
jgi:hypothetical protein